MTVYSAETSSRSPALDRWRLGAQTWRDEFIVLAVVGVLYYAAGWLALRLLSEPEGVAVFWPASGLAAGAIVALTRPARVPIALAVIAATAVANLQSRTSIEAIAVFALCNALECLLFGWLFQALDRSRAQLESLWSVAAFLVAAALGAGLAAIPAALAIGLFGLSSAPLPQIWLTWFQSDALGIVAVAPMLITLPALLQGRRRIVSLVEGSLLVVAASAVAFYIFGRVYGGPLPVFSPASLLFPILLWLAGRTPIFFSAVAVFAVAVVIVMSALAGGSIGIETPMPLADRLNAAKVSVLTTGVAVLTLSAMFARIVNVAAALQSSEQRLHLALSAGQMYAFDYDFARGHVHRAGGLIERLGLPALGTTKEYLEALHADDRAAFEAMLQELSPAGPDFERTLRMRGKDGEILTIEFRAKAEFDAAGGLMRIRGTSLDVSERASAQKQLAEREEQLRRALLAGRVFAFEHDLVGNTVHRSLNAVDILGVPPDWVNVSRNLFMESVHPDDRAKLRGYTDNLTPEEPFSSGSFRFIRPDGQTIWLEVMSTGQFDQTGSLIGIRGLTRDATARARAEQQQTALIQELDHRVKNALARMAVVIELSREGHQSLDDYVAVIQGRISSMARTQERLSGNKWVGIDLSTLIADELAPYRTAENCRIEGPELVLEPDTAQAFAFTLHELATNAVKYGGLATPRGHASVVWQVTQQDGGASRLELQWRETAEREIKPPQRESYGLKTIRNLLRYEQKAKVDVRFTPTGLECDIGLGLPPAAAAREPPLQSA